MVQIAPSKTPVSKTPKSNKEATPRNLKMVSLDFFGAQPKKSKKVIQTPVVQQPQKQPIRNIALERLAKKAEERDNQLLQSGKGKKISSINRVNY